MNITIKIKSRRNQKKRNNKNVNKWKQKYIISVFHKKKVSNIQKTKAYETSNVKY